MLGAFGTTCDQGNQVTWKKMQNVHNDSFSHRCGNLYQICGVAETNVSKTLVSSSVCGSKRTRGGGFE